jgi:predicted site-specific integrase-resolvase
MKIYNSREVSEKTGVTMRTLQRWSKSGKIGTRLGREYMYTDEDLETIMQKCLTEWYKRRQIKERRIKEKEGV